MYQQDDDGMASKPLLSKQNGTSNKSSGSSNSDASKETCLVDVDQIDAMFPIATAVAFAFWILMILLVYSLVPPEDYVYLDGAEREAAAAACYVFIVSTSLTLVPMLVRRNEKREVSGVVWACFAVQFIAMCTNGMLAWAPTVVVVDKVTHARVYLIRWAEWVPLSGLMTFFAEIVDCQEGLYGVLIPVLISLGQSLSCLLAVVFPFCPSFMSWVLCCLLSVALYSSIFPRLFHKYKLYKTTKQGLTLDDMERTCRIAFAFHLLATCTAVWTILVFFYFANVASFRYYPDAHAVKNKSLPMILDTLFDVVAKALYMKVIVDVHEAVFDADGRARRQLSELKRMITVLWESSSDVIVISVRNGSTFTTMISPTFPNMLGVASLEGTDGEYLGAALMVKSKALPVFGSPDCHHQYDFLDSRNDGDQQRYRLKSETYFVDAWDIPYSSKGGNNYHHQDGHLKDLLAGDTLNEQAGNIISAVWAKVSKGNKSKPPQKRRSLLWNQDDSSESDSSLSDSRSSKKESLVVLDMKKMDGMLLKSEIKVSQRSDDAVIAIVRDVTERYLRFDAERRVHTEALARQKDAHAVNRFTRHEIKNGLLAGIEMCQEVSKRFDMIKTNTIIPIERLDEFDATKCLTDLDACLHEILETVLAEAMAREVIHESYRPKLDRVDVYDVLTQGVGTLDEVGNDRFSLHLCPSDMPCLSMDPQLLKYIHRNAVSNACKYGKNGGKVTTEVHFFENKGEFEMDVCNEPGPFNEELMKLGEAANDIVFAQGTRLEVHSSSDDETMNHVSSGDGAWIMQKCAKTMGGICTIRFDANQTVFSFRCKAEAYRHPWQSNEEFQVPPGTWGLAYDDTSIQRKLMQRIMKYAGVDESKIVVKGKSASDIHELDRLMLNILSHDNTGKLLVLMDENLDYHCDGVSQRLSGSKFAERALGRLTPDQQARMIVLVRSANDSDDDIATYKRRTHGFFPKASMHKERVRELLASAWLERFPDAKGRVPETVTDASSVAVSEIDDTSAAGYMKQSRRSSDSTSTLRTELLAAIHNVDCVVERGLDKDWLAIWSALHALKGDLSAVDDNKSIAECIKMLSDLRGAGQPRHFQDTWTRIRKQLLAEIG